MLIPEAGISFCPLRVRPIMAMKRIIIFHMLVLAAVPLLAWRSEQAQRGAQWMADGSLEGGCYWPWACRLSSRSTDRNIKAGAIGLPICDLEAGCFFTPATPSTDCANECQSQCHQRTDRIEQARAGQKRDCTSIGIRQPMEST